MKIAIACLVAVLAVVPAGYASARYAADRLDLAAAKIVADAMVGSLVDVAVTLWR
jgi:hypothetical protein